MRVHSQLSAATAGRSASSKMPALSRVPAGLFVIAIVLLYVVSGGMLWLAGINYDGLTGSPATKIHPGTYLVVTVFCWAACESGNPVGLMADMARRRPASLLMMVTAFLLFLQIVSRKAPGMAGTIDTYLLPALVATLFMRSGTGTRRLLELSIHAAMLANAGLGLVEFATKHLYFPFRFEGVALIDTRATALQGHPLGNATQTAVYILALIGGGGTLSASRRLGMIASQLAAMVAFGGRVALVVTIVLGGAVGLKQLHRSLRSGRVPLLGAAALVVALTLVPLVLAGLFAGGFFDALLIRFQSDGGSANARLEMLDMLQAFPLHDLVVGPDIDLVESLRRVNGLELGIESPIVKLVLYQGIVLTALVLLAIGLFFGELVRWSRPGVVVPVLAFLIIINTFESIASKSTMVAKVAIMMLVLFRPTGLQQRRGLKPKSRDPASVASDRARLAIE